jgi:hypothetical protein
MTPWKTSEIARRLAERDDVEPPEGLLEKIKSDIPAELPMLPTLPRVPEIVHRSVPPKRRTWLMAASLAAAVCGGAFGLWMMQNVGMKKEAMEETAREQGPAAAPAPTVPVPAPPAVRQMPAAKEKEAERLKALGYVGGGTADHKVAPVQAPQEIPAAPKPMAPPPPPPPAKQAAPRDEPLSVQAESQPAPAPAPALEGGVPGGVVGGVAGGAPGSEKDERRADKEEAKKAETRNAWDLLDKTPGAKTDRINAGGNESGRQADSARPAAAAPSRIVSGAVARPSLQASAGEVVRRSLAEGRLPPPESVRVEDLVRSFSVEDQAGGRSRLAAQADGAPNPFAAEEGSRLLRVTVPAVRDTVVRVDFNPAAVSSWRRLGADRSQTTATARGDSIPAGSGATVLYAVTLKPGVQPSQPVLTLHLGSAKRDLRAGDLPPSWEKATPDLRLVALAAELAEVLRGSPAARDADLDDLVRRARAVATALAGTPRAAAAADLVKMAEEVARLKR